MLASGSAERLDVQVTGGDPTAPFGASVVMSDVNADGIEDPLAGPLGDDPLGESSGAATPSSLVASGPREHPRRMWLCTPPPGLRALAAPGSDRPRMACPSDRRPFSICLLAWPGARVPGPIVKASSESLTDRGRDPRRLRTRRAQKR